VVPFGVCEVWVESGRMGEVGSARVRAAGCRAVSGSVLKHCDAGIRSLASAFA
jgi:hypothetical protein